MATPMMRQYLAIKEEYADCILFFRLGDFYEMFNEDAIEASQILNITLTARKNKGGETPMCGVPYHSAESYLAKLVKNGKKVAICEQVSDPDGTGIVQREVVRVVTPGTTMIDSNLETGTNNYVISVYQKNDYFGFAFCDLSTGEFRVCELKSLKELQDEIARLNPSECILPKSSFDKDSKLNKFLETFKDIYVSPFHSFKEAYPTLIDHFGVKSLDGFGIENMPFGISAAFLLIEYLKETQKTDLTHIKAISAYNRSNFMIIGEETLRNLELLFNTHDGSRNGSLIGILDKTKTAMGARMLRSILVKPLIEKEKIEQRLDAVENMFEKNSDSDKLREKLKNVCDIERLLSRISLGVANARDLKSLHVSLEQLPEIKELLNVFDSKLIEKLKEQLFEFSELRTLLDQALADEPPVTTRDGGMIKDGYNEELDKLRNISRNGKDYLKKLQEEEIEKTGISKIKIGFNKVFGYYIEISKIHKDKIPERYITKQTLANTERYITPELKQYEEQILSAEDKIKELEFNLFMEVRDKTLEYIDQLQEVAFTVAYIDLIQGFAKVSKENRYARPIISDENVVEIVEGRHPVVEKMSLTNQFIPNDVKLNSDQRFVLITGPNMAGKSTYLRQIALIVLMAQIGCFVPAKEALISVHDRIFTRVGASDNLSKGQSTFMVEMHETANILNNATDKSLIILDEIGRGTSTYDGLSLAWAITEHLHDKIKSKTLFATHYHELTAVIERLKYANNFSVSVREENGEVVFLHKILEGSVSRSYGIEVAKLAGIPSSVVDSAKSILRELEEGVVEPHIKQVAADTTRKVPEGQMELFEQDISSHPVFRSLKDLDLNQMTPIQALQKLSEIREKIEF